MNRDTCAYNPVKLDTSAIRCRSLHRCQCVLHKNCFRFIFCSEVNRDDRFTYIKSTAPEKFAVYEVKDGKPDLGSEISFP